MVYAKETQIPTYTEWKPLLDQDIQIIIDVTGKAEVFQELLANRPCDCSINTRCNCEFNR